MGALLLIGAATAGFVINKRRRRSSPNRRPDSRSIIIRAPSPSHCEVEIEHQHADGRQPQAFSTSPSQEQSITVTPTVESEALRLSILLGGGNTPSNPVEDGGRVSDLQRIDVMRRAFAQMLVEHTSPPSYTQASEESPST
ncbi:hypothetical protein SCHPADRAFT_574558 [Schizopora paradoxa]|uniref:Uncharacterized protein n=1 Tax=Schizopora paradoxa TaxID=27342 RepID=A0A0H2RCN6_9AGAM|nr:hypothetical protein SCHPADRAFT_574558 [Schizopora paradoxa]